MFTSCRLLIRFWNNLCERRVAARGIAAYGAELCAIAAAIGRHGVAEQVSLKHDRFKWEQESSRFFEKKRRKKLLFGWACGGITSTAKFKKVFLLLFVHKKKPFSSLRHDLS
jgi:hypothetical protein